MSENCNAIEVHALRKRYGDVTAVDGLDLVMRRGECFGLLGPNGAGKTTTVEILEGLNEPTGGDVQVLGRRWTTHEAELRARLGISLQETHLQERLTVAETLRLFRSFYDHGKDPEDLMKLVSLEEKRDAWFTKLSGGQKQRLAVACALVGDPELLFLDEPTTGLDPQSRRQLWDIINGLRAEGRSVLLTTHYMDEAERLCDRVGIVDKGKMIALGTPAELIASLGGEQVIEFTSERSRGGTIDELALGQLPGVRAARHVADGYALTVDEVHVSIPALLDFLEKLEAPLTRLSTHHATLEDVFVSLTGRQLRE
ncbi:MAG TPA: ABC transporter ATP-binding protein [Polyangia bacterium]|nr:ABC transporter ATP-binding protein [Polyangia bacterium]